MGSGGLAVDDMAIGCLGVERRVEPSSNLPDAPLGTVLTPLSHAALLVEAGL